MDDRVDMRAFERRRFVAEQARLRDVARHDRDALLDIAVEAGAQMFAQRAERGRFENFPPEAVMARFAIAANQQMQPGDLRMMPQENRNQHFAEKTGRARNQQFPPGENFRERRHRAVRRARGCAVAARTGAGRSSVPIRHRRSPAAASADR
jgi:hypothetical protein